ncbi:MAG: hypothetical protein A2Y73_02545 [Chloroflexi bacterium RBG_13_56_8]|nr:MAG: hypothetical protein A2Y73_02545 [Chloroflexi bacterium RBG_13_56_8]
MPGFEQAGRVLLIVGVLLIVVGLFLTFGSKIPLLGRLPGDLHIQRGRFSLFLPLASSLLVSIILTVLLNVILRLFRK